MQTKYVIVFALFCIAVFVVLFPKCISWLVGLFRTKQPEKTIQFTESVQLKWGDYFWEGRLVLPSWSGFQKRLGPYSSVSGCEPSVGEVQLSVSSPDESKPSPPCEAQVRSFCYIRDNDCVMCEKVLKAIFDVYPAWRENYKDFLGEEFEKQMPVLHTLSDLKSLIGLSTVHILNVEKDGLAYVGFEFGCTWDEEHGLGVMSIGGRIIDVGSAEEAFSINDAN
jgi:hypothetical protein